MIAFNALIFPAKTPYVRFRRECSDGDGQQRDLGEPQLSPALREQRPQDLGDQGAGGGQDQTLHSGNGGADNVTAVIAVLVTDVGRNQFYTYSKAAR